MECELQPYTQCERIACHVRDDSSYINREVATLIAHQVRERAAEGKHLVLGLSTGSTPTGMYAELVRLHREEGLSLANVITFNLDEYYPMNPAELQSHIRFMNEHLFDSVDIDRKNIHVPDGTLPLEAISQFCADYEARINAVGGIDILIMGIGRTGHIGFNEPGSDASVRTRLITLDRVTRIDAASDFFGADHVPRRAITMGVATILEARQLILLAFGEGKASIIKRTVEGGMSTAIPATFLQQHQNASVWLDEAAAAELSRITCPWLLGKVDWTPETTRRAVLSLSADVKKPLLKLTDADYNEAGMQDLLAERGSAYEINLEVFRHMQGTITGWPGGKPASAKKPGDRSSPYDDIFPKRVLIFSPHPDDDVISMGGTLIRLVDQGHIVHVAYQTSGNIAVFDDDAIRFSEFVEDYANEFQLTTDAMRELDAHVDQFLRNKQPGQVDSPAVQRIKGLIRKGEARAATRYCGISGDRLHFQNLPFYETGRVKKKPLGTEDVDLTVELLHQVQPHQIYAAGDLSDPHGTHRTCLAAIMHACNRCMNYDWFAKCEVWLYRGAWQEWPAHRIDMAVPLSPTEVERKRVAIFKHQSQKDRALFPGSDIREFWQRAEDRNAQTAQRYDQLGLPEYQAIEGFVRWDKSSRIVL
jgi:glucosamine-6-phosphate deaminase